MKESIETLECGQGQDEGKRRVAVLLKREQLIYDIENYCYIEGELLPEDGGHQQHMVQDVAQGGNVDRVTRVLDLAYADVVERLYPFTRREMDNEVVDDWLRDKSVYGIILNVPEEFSQTTLNLVCKLIHELMVCTAVADWMSITNPQKEEAWRMKAEAVRQRINQIRNHKRGRYRIRPHWL